MSKVISFSISDRYLDKLRTLYPHLTDNLAVKQFVTDGLESSLGNSLDDSLDDGLDGKLKSLIESELDGLLDERLDSIVGKLISDLSERLTRLEERLDDSLDGRLDEMELLLRMQREASIASPLPPIEETSPLSTIEETVEAAIEPVATVETADKVETAIETVEAVTDTVESVEPISLIVEPDKGAIETVGMTSAAAYRFLASKNVNIAPRTLDNWIRNSKIPESIQGEKVQKYLILKDKKYYSIE